MQFDLYSDSYLHQLILRQIQDQKLSPLLWYDEFILDKLFHIIKKQLIGLLITDKYGNTIKIFYKIQLNECHMWRVFGSGHPFW